MNYQCQGHEYFELYLSGLMMKDSHTDECSERSADECEKDEHLLGNPPEILLGFVFVYAIDHECDYAHCK